MWIDTTNLRRFLSSSVITPIDSDFRRGSRRLSGSPYRHAGFYGSAIAPSGHCASAEFRIVADNADRAGILRRTAANGDEIVRAALGKDLKPFTDNGNRRIRDHARIDLSHASSAASILLVTLSRLHIYQRFIGNNQHMITAARHPHQLMRPPLPGKPCRFHSKSFLFAIAAML